MRSPLKPLERAGECRMIDTTSTWYGKSGAPYTYHVSCLLSNIGVVSWRTDSGNYIFAKLNAFNRWEAVYIGEADSLARRLVSSHEKLPCARKYGATHILTHTSSTNAADRRVEEDDLRASNPNSPCNLQ